MDNKGTKPTQKRKKSKDLLGDQVRCSKAFSVRANPKYVSKSNGNVARVHDIFRMFFFFFFLCRRSSPSSSFRPLTLAKQFKSPPFFPETPSALLPLQPVPVVGRVLPEGGEGEGGQGRLQVHEGHGRHLLQVRRIKCCGDFPRIGKSGSARPE